MCRVYSHPRGVERCKTTQRQDAPNVQQMWQGTRHRFWECCENKKIESEDVIKSQRLCEQAKKQWGNRGACFWNGGALPHNLRAEQPRAISESKANAKAEADFVEALDKECLVATDGVEGLWEPEAKGTDRSEREQRWCHSGPTEPQYTQRACT